MSMTLREISDYINGRLIGDGNIVIKGVAGIKEASHGDLTFLVNRRYFSFIKTTGASAVIVSDQLSANGSKPLIITENPYISFLKIVKFFIPEKGECKKGIHPSVIIGDNVRLGDDISIQSNVVIEEDVIIGDKTVIYPGVYIGKKTSIGKECIIYPNVVLREEVYIGNNVIIHGGAVIGCDGFGFTNNGKFHEKVPQLGRVVIEDDVEVGANVAIDRATVGKTWIKRGTKIDNLVQVAHNVVIGENTIICAQTGISGSTEVGKNVILAGQSGLTGHIVIGDNVSVAAKSGVSKSIEKSTCVIGNPARPYMNEQRTRAYISKIPDLVRKIRQLEDRLEKLNNETKNNNK